MNIKKNIRNIGVTSRFYKSIFLLVLLFVLGYMVPVWYVLAKVALIVFIALVFVDAGLLYSRKKGVVAKRILSEKLSNGDDNLIVIEVKNTYTIKIQAQIIDEIPWQFQVRNFLKQLQFSVPDVKTISYSLRPVERGEYHFGRILTFISTQINLLSRRYPFSESVKVPVYPSFIQMHKYQLMAVSNRLMDAGIKPVRKIGHHTEFDQIRNYIKGDDYRTINWKATARKSEMMVNQFMEEKSQPVYSIIDMGRTMKSPFQGMTLLDYAINAALVFSNIALCKSDKAGLITFDKTIESALRASNRPGQMRHIMELLYNQRTNYMEPNFELLYATVRRKITQRSLLMLFTNFEGPVSLQKQMKYLAGLAKNHLLLVVIFKNTEMYKLTDKTPQTIQEVYTQTIAEKMLHDKVLIQKELNRHGILSVLTTPDQLTPDVINEYITVKARGLI